MITNKEQKIIEAGMKILEQSIKLQGLEANRVSAVIKFCQLKLATMGSEAVGVLFLDTQHRLIEYKTLFKGGHSQCDVYPREIAREALLLNASAIILTHNHPSGHCEPSHADKDITKVLIEALGLFDIRILDHIIVGGGNSLSFANEGLI